MRINADSNLLIYKKKKKSAFIRRIRVIRVPF